MLRNWLPRLALAALAVALWAESGSQASAANDPPLTRFSYYPYYYYPHSYWEPNWSGETVLFDAARSDIIGAIYPRPNRLAIIRGDAPHIARGVSRTCPVLRITLIFKTRIEEP